MKTRCQYILLILPLIILQVSCDRTVTLEGRVLDIQGQELPGVAVTITGAAFEDSTDARGRYSLRCVPGQLELNFLKSGYTPGKVSQSAAESEAIALPDVQLWPLPPGRGVYVYENFRYTETMRIEPTRFKVKSGGQVFATKNAPELLLANPQPQLIAYKLPPFDAQIYRLKQVDAQPPELSSEIFGEKVWAPEQALAGDADAVTVISVPIDKPDQLLLELQLTRPLEYGTYAVHWGALNGHKAIEPNIYLFRVVDPEEEAKLRAELEAAADQEAQRRREMAESVKEEE